MKSLPLGYSDFPRLRREQGIYVDKTSLIYDLINNGSFYFLSRPRRFGKTLLLSAFDSLFKHGLRDFKGLEIEKLWRENKTYKVIRLDFTACSGFGNPEEFKNMFAALLKRSCFISGLQLPHLDPDLGIENVLDQFEVAVNALDDELIVLLIDEYDYPLNVCLDEPVLFNKVSAELANFYSCLKRLSGHFKFLFITGICRYRNLSGFTSGNYITDISMSPSYGALLGYTDEELQRYFGQHISKAASVLKITQKECVLSLKKHYDGFCFDHLASTHVFVPWSTLSFLNDPANGFRNYWFESAGHGKVILNYLKKHSLKHPDEYGQDRLVTLKEISSSKELDDISDVALLNETGYLTIKGNEGNDRLILNYPNAEVSDSMATLYMETMFGGRIPESTAKLTAQEIFLQKNIDEILDGLNKVFSCVDYMNYPVNSEASLRSHLQMYLIGSYIGVDVEHHNAFGRSDLEFVINDNFFVIELKFARKGDDEKILLNKALVQIRQKHYGDQLLEKKNQIKMALVFSESKRQFVQGKIIQD
ncbi:MAG: ATP-binding protein [Succinatimonas sp.]|nr:ATP-binding protein [Succinatimonas sp.]